MVLPDVYVSPFWTMSYARESVFNTAEAVASVNQYIGVVHRDFEIPLPQQTLTQKMGGGTAKAAYTFGEKRELKTTWNWELQNFNLFHNMMGSLITSGGPTPYIQTMVCGTQASRPLPSITQGYQFDLDGSGGTPDVDDDVSLLIKGTRLPKWSMSGQGGDDNPVQMQAELWGCGPPTLETAFPAGYAINTEAPYIFKSDSNFLTFHGAVYGRVNTFKLEVDHDPEYKWYDNGEYPNEVLTGECKIKLNTNIDIVNRSLFTKALDTFQNNKSAVVTLLIERGAVPDNLTVNIVDAYPVIKVQKGERATNATIDWLCDDMGMVGNDTVPAYPA